MFKEESFHRKLNLKIQFSHLYALHDHVSCHLPMFSVCVCLYRYCPPFLLLICVTISFAPFSCLRSSHGEETGKRRLPNSKPMNFSLVANIRHDDEKNVRSFTVTLAMKYKTECDLSEGQKHQTSLMDPTMTMSEKEDVCVRRRFHYN